MLELLLFSISFKHFSNLLINMGNNLGRSEVMEVMEVTGGLWNMNDYLSFFNIKIWQSEIDVWFVIKVYNISIISINLWVLAWRTMFRKISRLFTPNRLALGFFTSAFAFTTSKFWLSEEENNRINQKLKKKLNEKFHNRKDISF